MAVQSRHQIYHQAGFEEVAKPLQHRGGYERDQMKQALHNCITVVQVDYASIVPLNRHRTGYPIRSNKEATEAWIETSSIKACGLLHGNGSLAAK
ncbi:hypothetical protein PHLCEN_2v6160 [Hermanssonia centrifuga]|uniref:Uncharacterized protein n=1 Tax=Hermanssonia centrifuga TaxID=98765 RepID=A0A2R6P0A5_9APHY|nr:hypothetical protein PHLCEN_2v6160 [Hermanssonia centrifuga]